MKVFISSLIRGQEAFRDAAASAVANLRHTPVRAEDFGATPNSPQQACLAEVRDADVLLLILGAEYGAVQSSGLSATHEEYREARDTTPVLVFTQDGIEPERRQAEFIREVRGWEHGHFTAGFSDASELRDKVMRAIYDYALANEAAPLDHAELVDRAQGLLPTALHSGGPGLILAVASGPLRSVLRPAELDENVLGRFLLAEALTGSDSVLSPAIGTEVSVKGDTIQLTQERGSGLVSIDETANLLIVQPALDRTTGGSGITSVIEEDVSRRIASGLRFCARVLNHVDSAERLSHAAPVVALRGAGYMPWRTREEQERNPNMATMGLRSVDQAVVVLSPPVRRRAALLHETSELAEDFTVRLRREMTQ
jgi:hypothetical protein